MYKILTTFLIIILFSNCATTENNNTSKIIEELDLKKTIYFNVIENNIFSGNKKNQLPETNEYKIIGDLKELPLTQFFLFGKKYDLYTWDGTVNGSNYNFNMGYKYKLTYLDAFEVLSIEWSVNDKIIVENWDLAEQSITLPYKLLYDRDSISVIIPKPMSNSIFSDYMTYNRAKLIADKDQVFLFVANDMTIGILNDGKLNYKENLSEKTKELLIQYSSFCLSLQHSIGCSIKRY